MQNNNRKWKADTMADSTPWLAQLFACGPDRLISNGWFQCPGAKHLQAYPWHTRAVQLRNTRNLKNTWAPATFYCTSHHVLRLAARQSFPAVGFIAQFNGFQVVTTVSSTDITFAMASGPQIEKMVAIVLEKCGTDEPQGQPTWEFLFVFAHTARAFQNHG